jgi:sugar-specific transcriptional regulator TrmB
MSVTEGPYNSYEPLPPQAREVYRRVLQHQRVTPNTPGFSAAVELGVVVPDENNPGEYQPVAPGRIIARLVKAATEDITAISAFLSQLPAIREDLISVYGDVRLSGQSGNIEHLHGNELINDRIEEIIAGAERELITAQPGGPRSRKTLDRSVSRDTKALERGITMRTLYHATARHSPLTQEWAQVMAEKGGEIRTLDAPFLRLIIVDRAYAFIEDFLPRDPTEPNNSWAHLIQDPALSAFLVQTFERDWNRADYWHGSGDGKGGSQTTPIQRAILRQLSSGRTQEQSARDLGLSTRTLQKHLGALRLRVKHLHSVPQMTYWWATSPDRHLD